jgi:hypothetical protein
VKKIFALLAISSLIFTTQAVARDSKLLLSIEDAFQSADFQERLDPNIKYYFGDQAHSKVLSSKGNYVSNKKTNAFNKSDEEACKWVLLSALLSFQDRVRAEGGNAVINLESYYKKNTFRSDTQYECHAGAFIAGVALKGDVVKLAE